MSKAIGIDLGITDSVMAVRMGNDVRILQNKENEDSTPSVVAFYKGQILVGRSAFDVIASDPKNAIISVNRLIGRSYSDPEIQRFREHNQCELIPLSNGTEDNVLILLGGEKYSPVQISAMILKKLKEDAEFRLKERVDRALITVPSYLTLRQRDATQRAGQLAGFKVCRILGRSIAAAIANQISNGGPDGHKAALVYDFGGGCFEASILRISGGTLQVLCVEGDIWLGGENFNHKIMDYLIEHVKKDYGIDPRQNVRLMMVLKKEAEKAKIALSNVNEADIIIPGQFRDKMNNLLDLDPKLTRAQFEAMIGNEVEKTINIVKRVMWNVNMIPDQIDYVLLVGGSSKIPMVRKAVANIFGDEKLLMSTDPIRCVAIGAAILASRLEDSIRMGIAIGIDFGTADSTMAAKIDQLKCPKCGHLNPGSVDNCTECGKPLAKVCPSVDYPFKDVRFDESKAIPVCDLGGGTSDASILVERAEPVPYLNENAQFTVYRPKVVQPLRWYPLLAFAHLSERPLDAPESEPDPIEEVKRQAYQILGEELSEFQDLTQDSMEPIPRGGEITFVPEIPNVVFNPSRRTFLWQESVHKEEFRLRASQELDGRVARGRMSVFWGSILVAEINFSIRVDSMGLTKSQGEPAESVSAPVYRKIFASYSHKDAAIVEEFERYASALGDEYLRDVIHLRTGEAWNHRLMQIINVANVFQLFWSWNSIKSRFVEQEWRYALSLSRTYFVRPVYWEEPLPELTEKNLPPEELRRLHFQKIYPASPIKSVAYDHLQVGKIPSHTEPLGKLLVKRNVISLEQLNKAKDAQKHYGGLLGTNLVKLGFIKEDELLSFLSAQYRIPFTKLCQIEINPNVIKLIPSSTAKRYFIIPIYRVGSKLTLAMADPSNIVVIDEIKFMTGLNVEPVVASENEIIDAIKKYYGGGGGIAGMGTVSFQALDDYDFINVDDFDALVHGAVDNVEVKETQVPIDESGEIEGPIIKIVNGILIKAIKSGASDIHFEPNERTFWIQYRIDGVLRREMALPIQIRNAIVSCLKIMAKLDIAEKRLPKDEKIKLRLGKGREMDFQVSTIPTLFGEKVVLHLLDKSALPLDMTKLRFSPLKSSYNNNKDILPGGSLFDAMHWLKWLVYDPTNYDPFKNIFPSEASIRQDLEILRKYGFDGLITISSKGTLKHIPRIAHEVGLNMVIVGVFDLRDKEEVANALGVAQYADAYCLGHRGLNKLYNESELRKLMSTFRQKSKRPVTTSEVLAEYETNPNLMEMGDFLFPDAHSDWHSGQNPQQVWDNTISIARRMSQIVTQKGKKPVLLKMVSFPSGGAKGLSQETQAEFYRLAVEKAKVSIEIPGFVSFSYLCAFDPIWKTKEHGFMEPEKYTGLFTNDRIPKRAVEEVNWKKHL